MAINAALTDFTPAQRKVTYVPLPFQEMYAAMMEKQKRYDQADLYERQAKREMSALTSPISGHNEYLQKKIKEPFMEKVMSLHNSMPDKGSSDYQRKLNEIVDSYVSDPNLGTIQQSSAEYEKFIKTSAEQMAKGAYSNAAAKPYKEFSGLNPDGTVAKFQFMGLRSKLNVDGIIEDLVTKTPTQKNAWDITTIGGRKTGGETEIKSKDVIYSMLSNRIYNDPDLLADAMDQYNVKDIKELDKILKIKSRDAAINNTAIVSGWDSGLLNRQDKIAEAKVAEQQQAAYHIANYEDDFNSSILKQVEDYLDVNGNVKPVSVQQPSPWISPAGEPGERAFRAGQALAGNDINAQLAKQRAEFNLTSTASVKERAAYSRKKLLENPQFKSMVDNYMHAGLKQDDAIKMAGKQLRQMPHTQKRYEGRYIIDKNEAEVLNRTFQGLGEALNFYDFKNPTSRGRVSFEDVLSESGQENLDNIVIAAELAPVAGVAGNQNYHVTLGNKSWLVSLDSPFSSRAQSKALFDAERTKSPLKMKRYNPYEDDNTEHDALRQDAAKYGTDNVVIYTGLDGKLHLKREK